MNAAAEAALGSDAHGRTIEHERQVLGWITELARAPAPTNRTALPGH